MTAWVAMAHPRSALDRASRGRSNARGVDLAEVCALALAVPGTEMQAAEGRIVRAVAGKGSAPTACASWAMALTSTALDRAGARLT